MGNLNSTIGIIILSLSSLAAVALWLWKVAENVANLKNQVNINTDENDDQNTKIEKIIVEQRNYTDRVGGYVKEDITKELTLIRKEISENYQRMLEIINDNKESNKYEHEKIIITLDKISTTQTDISNSLLKHITEDSVRKELSNTRRRK